MGYCTMTAGALRDAGRAQEAERLDAARARAALWRLPGDPPISEGALALGVFGSRGYDDLAAILGIARWRA